MRWLVILFGTVLFFSFSCDDNGTDGDADSDGDADLGEEGDSCHEDSNCRDGLSCHCPDPPCINDDADTDNDNICIVCQPEGEGCDMSTECCRQSVCVGHQCVPVFGRDYEVQVLSASIYPRKEGGDYWDGADPESERDPDPYAVVTVGETSFTTSTQQNVFGPYWMESFIAHVSGDAPTPYSVMLYDEDGATDELIMEFGTEDPPIWFLRAWNLRQGGLTVSAPAPRPAQNQANSVNLDFVPQ